MPGRRISKKGNNSGRRRDHTIFQPQSKGQSSESSDSKRGKGDRRLRTDYTQFQSAAKMAQVVRGNVQGKIDRITGRPGHKEINGLEIVNGKVDGKIPLSEYRKYRMESIHNPYSQIMTLGKYEPTTRPDGKKDYSVPGPGAYTVRAGDTTYFSLGTKWDEITKKHYLDAAGSNMFEYFNKPALDDAVRSGKVIRFSHNPEAYGECALKWEWDYLKEKYQYYALEKKGGFWYASR